MTEESLTTDGPAPRPTGGGLAAAIAPEGVAALLAIVVVVVLLATRLTGSSGAIATATPSPSPTLSPTATPTPGVDTQAIGLLLLVDKQLLVQKGAIEAQTSAKQVDPTALLSSFQTILSELSNTGDRAARALAESQGGTDAGQAVQRVYGSLRAEIALALTYARNDLSAKNLANWRLSAVAVGKTLESIPALDVRFRALLAAGASPSASSEPSAVVRPSASASVPASASAPSTTPTSVTPPPATSVPTPSVGPSGSIAASPSLGPNLLVDGSFETGVGPPWQLVLSDLTANASVTSDPVNPHSPTSAARIDIASSSNRQLGIAWQQAGFPVEAGAFYHVSIALHSSDLRDVRIRIADAASGQILESRLVAIGAPWTVESFDFSSFVGSGAAVFAVDVGRSDRSVWIDDVSLARIPPG